MLDELQKELERAIRLLSGNIVKEVKADDALKYTQAALNLAHVVATLRVLNG